MHLFLQMSKLQETTSYFDENVRRVGVKSDSVRRFRFWFLWYECYVDKARYGALRRSTANLLTVLSDLSALQFDARRFYRSIDFRF